MTRANVAGGCQRRQAVASEASEHKTSLGGAAFPRAALALVVVPRSGYPSGKKGGVRHANRNERS